MATAEPVKYVSVPLPLETWQKLRELAAAENRPMSQLCAEWVSAAVSARDANRGRDLSAADRAA